MYVDGQLIIYGELMIHMDPCPVDEDILGHFFDGSNIGRRIALGF